MGKNKCYSSRAAESCRKGPASLRTVLLPCPPNFSSLLLNAGKLRALIRRILGWPEVVVVASYEGMKSLKAFLLPCNWDYCVLDEGQRIRNPDAEVPAAYCVSLDLCEPSSNMKHDFAFDRCAPFAVIS